MKKIILVITLLAVATPCKALTEYQEKLLHLSVMAAIDYSQSKSMFSEDGFQELNPILGKHPSNEKMAFFGVSSIIALYGVDKFIKNEGFKNFLIDSINATEKLNIEDNERVQRDEKRSFDCLMIVLSFEY